MKRIVTIIIALILLPSQRSRADTYYVDRNHSSASDTNPGTMHSPWRTIQHSAETVVAGDTVFIRHGVYNESLYFDNHGDDTNGYIIFSAYPGEKPVIDGTGVTDANNGINLDKSYIKLIGLEIRNWNENGVWIENASFLEITDCEVHHVFYGIGVAEGTHDFQLNRVEIHHFDLYGFDASPSGGADCYNGTFNDCIAYTGRDPGQNVDGFALGHGSQHDFTFNRCETYDVYDGFDVGENEGGDYTSVIFSRCSAYDCWNDGFKLTGQAKLVNCLSYNNVSSNVALYWDVNSTTSTLMNCTFFDGQTYAVWIENPDDTLQMYNCILAGGDNIGLAFEQRDAGNYVGDYNLFHNDNAGRTIAVGYEDEFSMAQVKAGAWTTSYSSQDANSLVASSVVELFVAPTNFDLHLLQTSVAVDQGTSADAPSEDYDGHPRPSGAAYDIGAYEYQHTTGVSEPELGSLHKTFKLYQNYPNPFNPETTIPFRLFRKGNVSLKVYNTLGQEVRTLTGQSYNAGFHSLRWDGLDNSGLPVSSGLYLYELRQRHKVLTKRMSLVR